MLYCAPRYLEYLLILEFLSSDAVKRLLTFCFEPAGFLYRSTADDFFCRANSLYSVLSRHWVCPSIVNL